MSRGLRTLLPALGAFSLPFLVGLGVHVQGFNLLDDGLWLLGGRLVTEGGILYRDLFSIYGPARYLVLAPYLVLVGQNAIALAVLKACLDGFAGLLGWRWMRRLGAGRWAWIVPLGVPAIAPVYPRYLVAAAFAMGVGGLAGRPVSRREGFLTGLAWGALALFGLDMAGYGGVILLGAWLAGRRIAPQASSPGPPPLPILAGAAAVAGPTLVLALVTGALPAAWWDTVVYPATRFTRVMGVSWLATMGDGRVLGEVFAGHHTGEALAPAWPGHGVMRILGLRLMFLLAWLVPVAVIAWGHRMKEVRWISLGALGVAGWVTLSGRGDVEHLRLIWFAVLLMTPLLLGRLASRRRAAGIAGGALLVLALGTLTGEQVWLATRMNRVDLATWDRPGAGIRLATARRDSLEEVCRAVEGPRGTPLLVWPAQPGLNFVLGAEPASPHTTLLPGEVRDPAAVVAALEADPPTRAVLGPAWGIVPGVRSLRRLEPRLWSYLRENYRFDREFALTGETYKILSLVPDGRSGIMSLPPSDRLPGAAQYLKTGSTPPLGPGREIVQTFRVDDFDLSGLALMFTAPGPFPYRIEFRLAFLEVGPGGQSRVMAEMPLSVTLHREVQKHSFPFRPLEGTRGLTLGIRLRDISGGERPFALMWHKPDPEDGGIDFHPEGRTYVDGRPVEADLYFVTY